MTFLPKFVVSGSIANTADLINLPHEDYPNRVPVTQWVIEFLTGEVEDDLRQAVEVDEVTGHTLRMIHSTVMHDMPDRGRYRTSNVRVGDHTPPEWWHVPEIMGNMLPINHKYGYASRFTWRWYREFQEIHPFRDGNGRVGGIVLAWLTFDKATGSMLAPCQ